MAISKSRKGIEKSKPECVLDYNKYMCGIDRADQMLSYYSIPRKTIRWYRKVFFHLIDICLWNSFYTYRTKNNLANLKFLEFREDVIRTILGASQKEKIDKEKNIPTDFHYLEPVSSENRKEKSPMVRCRQCSKEKRFSRSRYFCSLCPEKPGLCVFPCFRDWHK